MPVVTQLTKLLATMGRTTSDGTVVICESGLNEICHIAAHARKTKTNSLKTYLKHLEPDQVRVGEWHRSAIAKLLSWLGITLPPDDWSLIEQVQPPTTRPWTRTSVPMAAMVPAKTDTDRPDRRATGAVKQKRVASRGKSTWLRPKLIRALERSERELAKSRGVTTTLRKQLRSIQRHLERLQKAYDDVTQSDIAQDATNALQIKFEKSGRRLTPDGVLSTSIRRNMSMVACCDFGTILLEEHLGRYKVARCEIINGIKLQCNSRWFYCVMERNLARHIHDFAVGVHCYSSDATGGDMLRGRKLSTCIQDSSYYIDGVTDIDGGLADLPSQRRCCDVLAVEGGKTADTLALLTKHLASIGSPTWRCEPEGKRHLEAFLSVSDRGSDQALLRLTVPYDITSKNVVALSVDCFDHASHCTERTALGLIDIKLRKVDKQWS